MTKPLQIPSDVSSLDAAKLALKRVEARCAKAMAKARYDVSLEEARDRAIVAGDKEEERLIKIEKRKIAERIAAFKSARANASDDEPFDPSQGINVPDPSEWPKPPDITYATAPLPPVSLPPLPNHSGDVVDWGTNKPAWLCEVPDDE